MKALQRYLGITLVLSGLTVALAVAAVIVTCGLRQTAASSAGAGGPPLAALEERTLGHDAAIHRLDAENRLQDAHNVHSARALLRAAVRVRQAAREDAARSLATVALSTSGRLGMLTGAGR